MNQCEHLENLQGILDTFGDFSTSFLSPLQRACRFRNEKFIREYINNEPNINKVDTHGFTILQCAAKYRWVEIVQELLQNPEISIDVKTDRGETAFLMACTYNISDEILKLLAIAGTDVNIVNVFGSTALHEIFNTPKYLPQKIAMGRVILQYGYDIQTNFNNILFLTLPYPPLALYTGAQFEDWRNFLCMLLFYNADVNQLTVSSERLTAIVQTPFLNLLERNIPEEIDIFFDYVSDYNLSFMSYKGETSYLVEAIIKNNERAFEMIQKGADINYMNSTTNCLVETLKCNTSRFFRYIWNNCKLEDLLDHDNQQFLNKALVLSFKYSPEDFKEMMYIILGSEEHAGQLIEVAIKGNLYQKICDRFNTYEMSQDDRLKLIYTILTFDNDITIDDLLHIYNTYGFNEEFEAFLIVTVNIIDYKEGTGLFHHICRPQLPFQYEDHPVSLLKLSRDAFRSNMNPQFEKGSRHIYFQYYNKIQSMPIPRKIKDILCLKDPLQD